MKKFNKEIKKLNKIDTIDVLTKNKDKDILFRGMQFLNKKFNHKFAINIDPNILFKQYNLRTLHSIIQNASSIEQLLNSNISILNISQLLCNKYKIRCGFGNHSNGCINDIKNINYYIFQILKKQSIN